MSTDKTKRPLRTNFRAVVDSEVMQKMLEFTRVQSDESLIIGSLVLLHKLVNRLQKSPTITLDEAELKQCFVRKNSNGSNGTR